ncbi:hypothetical protein VNO78_14623 [Psophocarpus tetragonolobus]|uniref:Uncharacterized protein n=1 Tax=Psophocarpus tetragonolobus TaxID=3891 RepID=A0AAN9SCN2_PSOTE
MGCEGEALNFTLDEEIYPITDVTHFLASSILDSLHLFTGFCFMTRVIEIVKKRDSGGLVWKRIKLTTTLKANAEKRIPRVWQVGSYVVYSIHVYNCTWIKVLSSFLMNVMSVYLTNEAVIKACSEPSPSVTATKPQGNLAN